MQNPLATFASEKLEGEQLFDPFHEEDRGEAMKRLTSLVKKKSPTVSTIVGVAIDFDSKCFRFAINGQWKSSTLPMDSDSKWVPAISSRSSGATVRANLHGPFTHPLKGFAAVSGALADVGADMVSHAARQRLPAAAGAQPLRDIANPIAEVDLPRPATMEDVWTQVLGSTDRACLVLRGSFNPVHTQHVAVLDAARTCLQQNCSTSVVGSLHVLPDDGVLTKLRRAGADESLFFDYL